MASEPQTTDSAAPPQDTTQEEKGASEERRESNRNDQRGPSADFSALIDAIRREAQANREEESRKDRGKCFREYLTLIFVMATAAGVFYQAYIFSRQLDEMRMTYGPIRDQAEASKIAAYAATKQSENSDKTLVQTQRAWVGPINANIAAEPAIGKPVEITIQYQNSGREPALGFIYSVEPYLSTPAEEANWYVSTKILNFMNTCKITKECRAEVLSILPSALWFTILTPKLQMILSTRILLKTKSL